MSVLNVSENAKLTEREENRLKEIWKHLAGAKDGTIEVDGLKEELGRSGFDADSNVVGRVIARCDPDKSGKITWDNYRAAVTLLGYKLHIVLSLRTLFDRMDDDNDGKVNLDSMKEMAATTNMSHLADDERLEELFAKMDEEKAGEVEFRQFLAGLSDLLRRHFPDDANTSHITNYY